MNPKGPDMKRILRTLYGIVLLTPVLLSLCAADWSGFRGSDSNSLSKERTLPTTIDADENIAWKIELPGRGPSSPIVVGDNVFVTCSQGVHQDQLLTICIDANSGKERWRRQLWATGRTFTHPLTANAAPTPVSDGKRIYAFFSSNDLACFDFDGNLIWMRGLTYDYPQAANDVGMASSPILVGDVVVVQIENQGDSFAAGIDAKTGESLWRIERYPDAAWSSPVIWNPLGSNHPLLMLFDMQGLAGYDPIDGSEILRHEGKGVTVASPVTDGETIFVPVDGMTALKLDGRDAKVIWRTNHLHPTNSSPVVYRDKVFGLNNNILVSVNAASGERIDQLRLKGRKYWATPVIANDHLYVLSEEGLAQIIRIDDDGLSETGQFDFEETLLGSPAVADGAMYIRSDQHLWKIVAQ